MLQNVTYCPVLHARVAEIKALYHLPAPTKDLILPVIIARPWPNAGSLDKTWEKISEAVGSRRFVLDLDHTRYGSGTNAAASAFSALFDPSNGYSNYYDQLANIPRAIPVLRTSHGAVPALDVQIQHAMELDRGLVVRLLHGAVSNPAEISRAVLQRVPDVAFILDGGWTTDVLSREAWLSAIVEAITLEEPEAELVVCASSFPDSFSHMGARTSVNVTERELYARLIRRHNAAQLVYGDWGSTRPPSSEKVPMRNTPRIDLPFGENWICFRKDGSEGYEEIAARTISDSEWPDALSIWGTYTIQCTAEGVPGAIRSPGTAAAARVNIHVHRQAHFGTDNLTGEGDEPFTDD